MKYWRKELPLRLEEFAISDVDVWAMQPNNFRCKWRCSFVAALPPTARLRGLPKELDILDGDKVRVSLVVRTDWLLDGAGRIVKHTEEFVSGFDVADAIARYELLTARRRINEGQVSWYWKVLRYTTLEELAASANTGTSQADLESQFNEMVVRNFLYGLPIAVALNACARVVQELIQGGGNPL
eukprot:810539-Amphidinium_carterae.1